MRIGFTILSFNEPGRILRLVTTLNRMFDAPPIVCHHDFDQCELRTDEFPGNVRFVRPHLRTQWGHITTVQSALKALAELRAQASPDWFVQLSGSDYPVRSADEIVSELAGSPYDAYLDHRPLPHRGLPPGQTADDGGFSRPAWVPLAYDRYCASRVPWPCPSRARLRAGRWPFRRAEWIVRDPRLVRLLEPQRPAAVFGGCFWFQANRKVIDRLLDDPGLDRLVHYYGPRFIPEESLFHTVLCPQPDLRICRDHKRYEDWRGTTKVFPKWLQVSDLEAIRKSGAHFARKFLPDGITQDEIDRSLLGF